MIPAVITQNMTNQQSLSDIALCEECGTPIETIIEVKIGDGKDANILKRKVRCNCKCKAIAYEQRKKLEQEENVQNRLNKLRKYSMMDNSFNDCKFENWKHTEQNKNALKMGTEYTKTFTLKSEGLLISGDVGVGKTYLSFCIANELYKKRISAIAISSINFINMIQDSFGSYGKDGEAEIIRDINQASLLIIDDLGAEYVKDWGKAAIYHLIDTRCRSKKPLIITTNLSIEKLKEKFLVDGVPRIYDRISEMCIPIDMKGVSWRGKDIKERKVKFMKEMQLID